MDKGNKAKAEFLGMPYGTAANRLRKMLLFGFAQKLGYDECFVCGSLIEDIDDFTIEHKEAWLNRSVDNFWSLDNIAFSHSKCNHRTPNCDRHYDGRNRCKCVMCKDKRAEQILELKKQRDELTSKIRQLSEDGLSTRAIARRVGLSHVAVWKVLQC